MRRKSLHKFRLAAWLVSLAFALLALPTGAAWQCLDGHACPPGCTMQRLGLEAAARSPGSLPACCRPHAGAPAQRCPLCSGARPQHARLKGRCTSPVCVLRIQAKPDVMSQAPVHFVLDFHAAVAQPPAAASVPAPELGEALAFSAPRAPPGRTARLLVSPRAPPTLL
jgi:hypothetical protein